MPVSRPALEPFPYGDLGKPNAASRARSSRSNPLANVAQAMSPIEIARRQGIAAQQMGAAGTGTSPRNIAAAYGAPQQVPSQPVQRNPAAAVNLASTTNANDVYSPTNSARSLVAPPPANTGMTLAAMTNANDPQFSMSAVSNQPGAQNATSGLPPNNTDPANWRFDGSNTSWSPGDLETMLNDPYAFQRQFLQSRGMNTPGANAALGQYASRLNPLSMVIGGSTMQEGDQGNLEALSELYEGLLANYTTPGGRMPDMGEIMNTLAGVQNIPNGGDSTSLLQALLAGEDPEGQVSAIQQILGASVAGMPGLWGRAWSNKIDQAGTNYLDSTMDAYDGKDATMLDYLRNDPFFSRVR